MRAIINVDVPELEPAITFYASALGLQHSRTLDNDVAELTGASCAIYLLAHRAGSSPGVSVLAPRRYNRHWCPIHIDFVVDDVAEARQRALMAGARQESDCIEWRGSKCITFSDPFGHGFCLIEFQGEGYDNGGS